MLIKGLVAEDFLQYKKPSMVVLFPTCSFKCDKECKSQVCQNSQLALASSIESTKESIVEQYITNDITQAICFGGLEPFDSFDDMLELVKEFRSHTDDDIVIYTGYYKNEISDQINQLSVFPNIIVKFGRFIPEKSKVFDEVLGITLASDNQKAEIISVDAQKGSNMAQLKIRPRPIEDEDDQMLVDTVNQGLEENQKKFGKKYCPCSLEHTDDTVCMCKDFRDMKEPGFCHCGKYEKYYDDNA